MRTRLHPTALPLLALLLLLGPAAATAQEKVDLKGSVVEMGTARPLAGAEVGLPALDRWVIANGEGAFHFKDLVPGEYRIEVHQLGYRTHRGVLTVGAPDAVRLELWPDPVVLEGLSAQVDRLKRRRNAVPAVVRVAERDRLATSISMESAIRGMGELLVHCGAGEFCLMRRGRAVAPRIYIDERPAFGFFELESYQPADFHSVEVIGHMMIRAYTVGFMERLAQGKATLFPVLF